MSFYKELKNYYDFFFQAIAEMFVHSWEEIIQLLLQDSYFDTMFFQDFPFYFNFAYSLYR